MLQFHNSASANYFVFFLLSMLKLSRLNNFYAPSTLQVFIHFYINDESIPEFCLVLSILWIMKVLL